MNQIPNLRQVGLGGRMRLLPSRQCTPGQGRETGRSGGVCRKANGSCSRHPGRRGTPGSWISATRRRGVSERHLGMPCGKPEGGVRGVALGCAGLPRFSPDASHRKILPGCSENCTVAVSAAPQLKGCATALSSFPADTTSRRKASTQPTLLPVCSLLNLDHNKGVKGI
ncbi:hypothetical protein N657DRAFT_483533 [Parathielavia appendiculata]|uniref:Uncharacterized protein n=1 Tax=Parathielavia appendiculata TaxID=2587402 RepID=A0AAN6Z279_9PEZI|nr:hypothetical protein N657DRAFT_483533 [Parathielavia appendiculata]